MNPGYKKLKCLIRGRCASVVPRPHPVILVAESPGTRWRHYTLAWEQSADTPVDNYTLFWCQHMRDRPYQCEVRRPRLRQSALTHKVLDSSSFVYGSSSGAATLIS